MNLHETLRTLLAKHGSTAVITALADAAWSAGDVHTGKHARRWLRASKALRKAARRVETAENKGSITLNADVLAPEADTRITTTLGDAMGVLAEVIQEQGS